MSQNYEYKNMKTLLCLLLFWNWSLQINAKLYSLCDDKYSIEIPDQYVVKISAQGDEATLLVARSGRNPLSGINIVIYHAQILDEGTFEKNAFAYFASLKKGLRNFKESEKLEGDLLRYKASGTIGYKGVDYTMDAYASQYKNAVFYSMLYKGDEDKKLLDAVLSTFQEASEN